MTDPMQILLAVVITTLTIIIVIVGIEVWRFVKEARRTLEHTNQILDTIDNLAQTISTPISKLSQLTQGLQQGITLVSVISHLIEKRFNK